jgi:hypothetical protein
LIGFFGVVSGAFRMDSEDDMAYEDEYDNPDEDEDSSRFRAQRGDKHEEEVRQDQEDHIEVDDDDIDDGRNSDAGGPTCPRICTPDSGDYDVLSPEQVCQYMNEVVKEVSHIFEVRFLFETGCRCKLYQPISTT